MIRKGIERAEVSDNPTMLSSVNGMAQIVVVEQ
jgi:hypothetical protein